MYAQRTATRRCKNHSRGPTHADRLVFFAHVAMGRRRWSGSRRPRCTARCPACVSGLSRSAATMGPSTVRRRLDRTCVFLLHGASLWSAQVWAWAGAILSATAQHHQGHAGAPDDDLLQHGGRGHGAGTLSARAQAARDVPPQRRLHHRAWSCQHSGHSLPRAAEAVHRRPDRCAFWTGPPGEAGGVPFGQGGVPGVHRHGVARSGYH